MSEAKPVSRLSDREREIVRNGLRRRDEQESRRQARRMRMIETRRKNIMGKLGLKSFSKMVVYAIRNQITKG
jgi:DNA-binding CsgD family transcriptional regulator